MTDTPPKSRRSKIFWRLCFSLILFLVLGENTSRTLWKRYSIIQEDERNLAYEHHERLGWFPKKNSQTQYTGSVTIDVRHNALGFRDKEISKKKKRPRLAFIGDSFVWGFDAQEPERFTNLIAKNHPDWDIVNMGVSGYGSDQAFLTLQEHWETLEIDSVVLTVSYNDISDNNSNCVYGGYYKPYFELTESGLELKGVPVPKSRHYLIKDSTLLQYSAFARAILHAYHSSQYPAIDASGYERSFAIFRALQSFLKEKKVPLLIALQSKDKALKSFFESQKIPMIDVSTAEQFPFFGKHWTPKGNKTVAQKLEARFKAQSPFP